MLSIQSLLPVPTGSLQVPSLEAILRRSGGSGTQAAPVALPLAFSLVIPTYNESQNLSPLLNQLVPLLDGALPHQYELIVVDDDSPDRTWEVALSLTATYPHLRVLRRQQERGLSTAVLRGWQVARGEVLGVIDGDLQHPPEVLLQLLRAMTQGADLAVASRHVDGGGVSEWSLLRRCLSRGAQVLGLLLLPQVVGRVSDPMSGYFLVRRAAIAETVLNPLGYKILLEILARGRVKQIAEVGYVFQERQTGASKVTWKQYVEYLLHLGRLRTRSLSGSSRRISLPLVRLMRFGLVGLSGVFVDMAILYLLSDPSTLGWEITLSKILASELAILNNFFWNDRWTFGDIAQQQKGWQKRFKRFAKFNLICFAGLLVNVLILNALFNGLGWNRYLANLVAIGIVTLWNFWLNFKLSWRVTDASDEKNRQKPG